MNLIKTAFSMSYSLTNLFPCLKAPAGVEMSWNFNTRRLPVALTHSFIILPDLTQTSRVLWIQVFAPSV